MNIIGKVVRKAGVSRLQVLLTIACMGVITATALACGHCTTIDQTYFDGSTCKNVPNCDSTGYQYQKCVWGANVQITCTFSDGSTVVHDFQSCTTGSPC
jgi:hypothetical protein